MSMNRQKQRRSLLRAAKWIEENPSNWSRGSVYCGGRFDVMAACYPYKDSVLNGARNRYDIEDWLEENFPAFVVNQLIDINDTSKDSAHVARRVRAFVGRTFRDYR